MIILVIIPSFLSVLINGIIVIHVRASSLRVQPQITTAHITGNHIIHQHPKINGRDIRLLTHMLFMFWIFIGGWGPIYAIIIVMDSIAISILTSRMLSILGDISLLCIVIELFAYNHKLRDYLRNLMFQCCGI